MYLRTLLATAMCAFTLLGAGPLSPSALVASRDNKTLYVACATAARILVMDAASRKVAGAIALPCDASGLAISPDGKRLYATCAAAPTSRVLAIDIASRKVAANITAGHTAMGPVVSADGKTLYVANRFENEIGVIDLATAKMTRRIAVEREPVSMALTAAGDYLLVANHLHNGRADADYVAAKVSVIDVKTGRVSKQLQLPDGSGSLHEIRMSPDGRYAVVSHLIAHYHMPTSQLERGWMNTNAVTIIDAKKLEVVNSVVLDGVANGSANPWGVAFSADGKTLAVAHAGSHEITLTDFPGTLARLARVPARSDPARTPVLIGTSETRADVPADLSFLAGLRETVALSKADRGPRAIAVLGNRVVAANYFTDTLSFVDLAAPVHNAESVRLGPAFSASVIRKGEEYFNDGSLCFQRWQTCASCHPGAARVDALNWDLLNDGIGNPKNTKSMLLSHRTPPAMSLSIRESAEVAVRSGILHIQFAEPREELASAIDEYLKALKPVPSPKLVNGSLSPAALRGRQVFRDAAVGCATCHPEGLFTDLKSYEVGTAGRYDKGDEAFDTPTLIELWRTAPYLHDGSAVTLRELFTTRNKQDRHGKTSHLTPRQIDDLVDYLLSL